MSATKVEVTDPELMKRKQVDSSGKLYLGTDFAEEEVHFIITKREKVEE